MKLLLIMGWVSVAGAILSLGCLGPTPGAGQLLSYARSDTARGITIKAPAAVDPKALDCAKGVLEQMLNGREDIRVRLVERKAALAIIPRNAYLTALPEFASLAGQKDPNGNPYDSFAVRGAGAVLGQPVTATAEENLLKLPGDRFAAESVTHHEFAHAIMNLGFTEADHRRWKAIFNAASDKKLFPGAFAMTNPDEYWAELSQSYFSVNNEINDPKLIREKDPTAAAFLDEVYGSSRAGSD
jgi:hypothetical protein